MPLGTVKWLDRSGISDRSAIGRRGGARQTAALLLVVGVLVAAPGTASATVPRRSRPSRAEWTTRADRACIRSTRGLVDDFPPQGAPLSGLRRGYAALARDTGKILAALSVGPKGSSDARAAAMLTRAFDTARRSAARVSGVDGAGKAATRRAVA